MVIKGTYLRAIDNSGARVVRCIQVLGGRKVAVPGTVIVVSIKTINPAKKLRRGDIKHAVVVGVRKSFVRYNGISVGYDSNYVILINSKGAPIGSRVLGPVMHEVRWSGFFKAASMATFSF